MKVPVADPNTLATFDAVIDEVLFGATGPLRVIRRWAGWPDGSFFGVTLEDGRQIRGAIPSGALRATRLALGDRVLVAISPADPNRGMIIARHR